MFGLFALDLHSALSINLGVHYTTKEEEAAYRITRMRVANNEYQDAIVDEKNAPWIADVMCVFFSPIS